MKLFLDSHRCIDYPRLHCHDVAGSAAAIAQENAEAEAAPGRLIHRQLAAQFSWGNSVLGHDGRALRDVKAFDSGLVSDGENRSRIDSGDVTRCGDGVDLATANGFLASQPNLHLVFRSTCLTCGTFGSLMVGCVSWLASIPTIDCGTGAVFDEVLVARDIQLILSGHAHDSSTMRVISRGHHAQTILGCRYDTITRYDHMPSAW